MFPITAWGQSIQGSSRGETAPLLITYVDTYVRHLLALAPRQRNFSPRCIVAPARCTHQLLLMYTKILRLPKKIAYLPIGTSKHRCRDNYMHLVVDTRGWVHPCTYILGRCQATPVCTCSTQYQCVSPISPGLLPPTDRAGRRAASPEGTVCIPRVKQC